MSVLDSRSRSYHPSARAARSVCPGQERRRVLLPRIQGERAAPLPFVLASRPARVCLESAQMWPAPEGLGPATLGTRQEAVHEALGCGVGCDDASTATEHRHNRRGGRGGTHVVSTPRHRCANPWSCFKKTISARFIPLTEPECFTPLSTLHRLSASTGRRWGRLGRGTSRPWEGTAAATTRF